LSLTAQITVHKDSVGLLMIKEPVAQCSVQPVKMGLVIVLKGAI